MPSGNDSFLLQTSLTPAEEDWEAIRRIGQISGSIRWMVEGILSDGSVRYSEMWIFMIKEPVEITTGITDENTDGSNRGPCFVGTAASGSISRPLMLMFLSGLFDSIGFQRK